MESALTPCISAAADATSTCGWSLKKSKHRKLQAARALKLQQHHGTNILDNNNNPEPHRRHHHSHHPQQRPVTYTSPSRPLSLSCSLFPIPSLTPKISVPGMVLWVTSRWSWALLRCLCLWGWWGDDRGLCSDA